MRVFNFSPLHSILFCIISLALLKLSRGNILGNETDRFALLAFKSQITLDPYNVTSSWNNSHHFCQWEGVACSRRHQRVTELNLQSKGLVGPISPYIGNLTFLRILDLTNNSFHGEMPQNFGQLFRLEVLNATSNSLVGGIPSNISLCSNLKNLFLDRNNLVGKIPVELGSLSKLVKLRLGSNMLTGGITPSLGNLTSLEILSLSENSLGGSIPSILDQLKSLKILSLTSNKLYGIFPPSLFNLSSLEVISIPLNQLTGNLPTDIGFMLPNLRLFLIGGNQFSGPIPASLFNATGLQSLELTFNNFTGKVPPNVGNLKDLKNLNLNVNHLGNGKSGDLDFITSLANCSNLQVLGLGSNQFGGMLPVSIGNLSDQLIRIYLGPNQFSGSIPTEIVKLQNLIHLDLSGNSFTGSIPPSIGNLQNLGLLHLFNNQLSGQIPSSVRNMSKLFSLALQNNILEGSIVLGLDNQMLQILDLSCNNFTGTIPIHEIGLSSILRSLNLTHNSLNGSIPFEVGNLKSLEHFDVSENKMLGEIPTTLGSCSSLQYLFVQGNFFQGPLPSSLSSLKGLQVLDVSRNNISGNIPRYLEKLSLQSLNLSFNNLEGEVPKNGVFQNASAISVLGNNKICGGIGELKLPVCKIRKSKNRGIPVSIKATLGVVSLLLVVALFVVIYLRRKPKGKLPSEQFLGDLKRVSYNDLRKATDGFCSTNLLGVGNFGSVYKGILHQDEGHIAVKVLKLMERGALKSFMYECEALRGVRHRNLLKILTVCSGVDNNGNDFKAIVFRLMTNGSLENWLHSSSDGEHPPKSLNLRQRIDIAIDVATALNYLHNDCERPIVHCDLKSSNVLLDDDMIAHVGDFGLAKFLGTSDNKESISVALRGTIGYIPPEYGMGAEVSTKGDVYSYGILLLEMFTGKRPTDTMFSDGLSLHDSAKMSLSMDIVDMRMLSEGTQEQALKSVNPMEECLSSILRIGVACSVELSSVRMEIKDVLKELHSVKEVYLRA